uniref:Type-4 uracil-DNA glycosylase n=1 Tax=candidate division WWE3 bacterium TaxID=2053526 RepID=A0A831YT91_UNCKA
MLSKKEEFLAQIGRVVKTCHNCRLWRGATHAVPGAGNPNAAIMFVGEGPGYHEDKLGLPFVGRAGNLLDRLLARNGIKREEVFITNVVKHRPPDNRAPMKDETRACLPYLLQQIKVIGPKVIVPLGRSALEVFLKDKTISDMHGRGFKVGNRIIFPLYHPAAALRSPSVLQILERDFRSLMEIMRGKTLPEEIEIKSKDKNQMKLI